MILCVCSVSNSTAHESDHLAGSYSICDCVYVYINVCVCAVCLIPQHMKVTTWRGLVPSVTLCVFGVCVCSVFNTTAYENDHLAVFHSHYINDCVQAGERGKVVLGHYFLPPQDILNCM